MTFHEKLAKLTEDRRKTRLSLRAGLPANAISNYLSRRQMPSADIALRISQVLDVDVAWLVDDTQTWPPMRVKEREVLQGYAAAVAV